MACVTTKIKQEHKYQARIIYSARLCFKMEGEIKTFLDKQTLREFTARRIAL